MTGGGEIRRMSNGMENESTLIYGNNGEISKNIKCILSPGWRGERTPRACVIGLGLIGGSLAGALHINNWEVWALDPEKESLELAAAKGWVQESWSDWAELPAVLDVDLLVLALPLSMLTDGYVQLAGRVPQGAIVTDVGSVKMEIGEIAQNRQEGNAAEFYFVGGHPMTGSERSGFHTAHPHLFRGYPYVLSPGPDCPSLVTEKMAFLLQSFGAQVVFREPKEHDTEVAMVSHIPHLLAVALMLAAQDVGEGARSTLALAGRSFRDVTRIADSSPEMWREILLKNSGAVLAGLDCLEQRIQTLRKYIEQRDGEAIAEAFRQAHELRDYL